MLTKLAVRDFRSFGSEQAISFRRLTIVMGKNSSGKSSLLRAMFILRQTVETRDRSTAAVFDGAYAQFGSFSDFAHLHSSSALVGVDWSWSVGGRAQVSIPEPPDKGESVRRRQFGGHEIVGMALSATFSYNRRTTEVRSHATNMDVELRRGYMFRDGRIVRTTSDPWKLRLERRRIDNRWSELSYATEVGDGQGSYKIRDTGKFYDLSIGRYHTRERKKSGPYRQMEIRRIASGIAAYLEGEAERMVHLGPLRTGARRFYLLTGERPDDVGLAGEKSVELLWMTRRSKSRVGDFLGRWLKAFDISLNIKLRRIARTSFLAVELVDPMTNATVDLADVGVGGSQVLPILIGGYLSAVGSTLVIEQPELHLHPAAQSEMADALVELMRDGRQVIVETHSEHLVRRIQRRIAEGSVGENEVALYYVDRREGGSVVLPIPLDESGSFLPESLPEGFFDVDFREAEAITSAWRAKRNG